MQQGMLACAKGLGEHSTAFLKGELLAMLVAAAQGRLSRYEKETDAGDVRLMTSKPRVLEIRFTRQFDRRLGGHRYVRLYFFEPAHQPATLLALLVAWKMDYPVGKLKQQLDIREADSRLTAHYRRR